METIQRFNAKCICFSLADKSIECATLMELVLLYLLSLPHSVNPPLKTLEFRKSISNTW